jgi:hypothetical protein
LSKKLFKFLDEIAKGLGDMQYDPDEIIEAVNYIESDDFGLTQEVKENEGYDAFEDDVLDILRAVLVYILIKDVTYEKEDAFSLVFGGGKRILWN